MSSPGEVTEFVRKKTKLGRGIGMPSDDADRFGEVMERLRLLGMPMDKALVMGMSIIAVQGVWHCCKSKKK